MCCECIFGQAAMFSSASGRCNFCEEVWALDFLGKTLTLMHWFELARTEVVFEPVVDIFPDIQYA